LAPPRAAVSVILAEMEEKNNNKCHRFKNNLLFCLERSIFSAGVFILPCGKTMECLQFELLFSAAVCYNGHTMTI
jgi:hypothetical protein